MWRPWLAPCLQTCPTGASHFRCWGFALLLTRVSAWGEGGGGGRRGREGVGGRGFCCPNAQTLVILRETAFLKASEAGDMRIGGGGGVEKEGRRLEVEVSVI